MSLGLACYIVEILPNILQYNKNHPLIPYPRCCPSLDSTLFWAAHRWLSLAWTRGSCRWLVMMLSCSEDQLRWRAVAYQLFFKFKRGLDPIQICTAARYSCSWSWRLCILASATTPSLHKADSARAPANHVCAAAGPHHGQACSVGYCAQHHTAEAHGAATGAAP